MIVVTAAGGQTGAAVVRTLRDRREAVRAVVSHPGPRPELTALGAEVVVAELTLVRPPRSYAEHLAGLELPS